jgi:hypothetical protein
MLSLLLLLTIFLTVAKAVVEVIFSVVDDFDVAVAGP